MGPSEPERGRDDEFNDDRSYYSGDDRSYYSDRSRVDDMQLEDRKSRMTQIGKDPGGKGGKDGKGYRPSKGGKL